MPYWLLQTLAIGPAKYSDWGLECKAALDMNELQLNRKRICVITSRNGDHTKEMLLLAIGFLEQSTAQKVFIALKDILVHIFLFKLKYIYALLLKNANQIISCLQNKVKLPFYDKPNNRKLEKTKIVETPKRWKARWVLWNLSKFKCWNGCQISEK